MAITTLSLSTWGTVTPGSGDAVTNGGTVVYSAGDLQNVVFLFNATAPGTITVVAGNDPPAIRAGLGSVAQTVAGTTWYAFGAETARFASTAGSISFVSSTGAAGTIYPVRLPLAQ